MAIKPTTRAIDAALDALETLGFDEWDIITCLMALPVNPREFYNQFCITEDKEAGFDPTWIVNMLDEMGDMAPALPPNTEENEADYFFADFSDTGTIYILYGWEGEILVELMEALHYSGPNPSTSDSDDDDDDDDEEGYDEVTEKEGEISRVGLGTEPIPLPNS